MENKKKCLIKNIMNVEHLFTEDEIIIVGEDLKNLKGKILLDDHNEFFVLKDYNIKSFTITDGGWFKKKTEEQAFYIDFITLTGVDEDITHKDNDMCSLRGVRTLLEYRVNFSKLEKNLIKFTLKNSITLKYGELSVTTNKSSNFKRR
jgi:hypothetical protein